MKSPNRLILRNWLAGRFAPVLSAVGMAVLVGAPSAQAANGTWTNAGTTDFNLASNWTPGLPGTTDRGFFDGAVVNQPSLSSSITMSGLTFSATASNYNISSSSGSLTLTGTSVQLNTLNAIYALNNASGTNTISAPIILGQVAASGVFFTQSGSGTLAVTGPISSTNAITGITLSGAAGSKFTLSGNNTYSGNTTLATSVLLNINNATAISSGNLVTAAAVIDNTSGAAITLSNNNSILAGGTITYGGTNDLNFGTGAFISNGSTRIIQTNGTATLTFGSLDASVSGVGFTKSGGVSTGILAITGAAGANLTGLVTLGGTGTTIIGHKSSLGTGTVQLSGGTFSASNNLSGGNAVANAIIFGTSSTIGGSNNIELSGNATMSATRALTNSISGGNLTLSGATLGLGNGAAAFLLTLQGTGNTIINSVIQDNGAAGSLTINNVGGSVALNGNNTYTGTTSLSGGSVTVGHKAAFGTSALNWAAAATTLSASTDLSGANKITNSISLLSNSAPTFSGSNNIELGGNFTQSAAKIVTNNIASGKALTFSTGVVNLSNSASNFIMTFAGSGDTVVNSVIQNGGTSTAGGVTINATGSVTLAGTNTYGGVTTVTAGTLLINGNSSGAAGNVSVAALGILGGNGTIGGATTVANNGPLAPGTMLDATTTLTLNNKNLTISGADSKLNFDITGTGAGDFDKLAGIAAFTQNGDITFTLSGTYASTSWDVMDFTSKSANFDTLTLAGSYVGTLARTADTWTGTVGSQSWTFEQTTGLLSVGVVPEPATWALLAFGLTSVMVRRRRRD